MLEGGGFESDGLSERRKGEAVQNKPPLGFKQEVNSNGDEGPLGRTSCISLLQT